MTEESKKEISTDVPERSHLDEQREIYEQHLQQAPEFLKDPALLHRVKTEYLNKDIVGEDTSKLLVFTILATSLTNTPLGVVVTGESSTGKSWLVSQIAKHFPNVIEYTRITGAAPDRSQQDFTHKILYIGELYGLEAAQGSLRVLISEGKLRLWTTARDDEGHIVTEELETKGVPVFVTTTTSVKPDEELLNRLFLVSTDDSEEQTKRILAFEAFNFEKGDAEIPDVEPPKLADYLEMCLRNEGTGGLYRVPFAKKLANIFPTKTCKARRDFKKLSILIGAIATLHIYQRPIVYSKNRMDKRYVVALPIDLYLALRICGKSLRETLFSLQDRMIKVLKVFEKQEDFVELTVSNVAEEIELSERRTGEILNELRNKGYLTRKIDPTDRRKYRFSLKRTENDEIITSDDLASILESFTEKELREFLIDFVEITRYSERSIPTTVIDPLTGRLRNIQEMLEDLHA